MKLYTLIFAICVFALSAFGQQRTDSSADDRIISFSQSEQMFQLLDGRWIFNDMTCAEPYTVKVSANRKSIKFQYAKPQKWADGTEHDSFVYNVMETGDYFIRTQIEGEARKSDDGKPIGWDFLFLSSDEFVWHRTDWQGLNSTKSVKRCEGGKVASTLKPLPEGAVYRKSEIKTINGGMINGKAISLPKPKYPAAARAERAIGTVNVQVTIDESGNVTSAAAISGHQLLRTAAEEAARLAQFSPTTLSGQPVKVTGIIVYNFVP